MVQSGQQCDFSQDEAEYPLVKSPSHGWSTSVLAIKEWAIAHLLAAASRRHLPIRSLSGLDQGPQSRPRRPVDRRCSWHKTQCEQNSNRLSSAGEPAGGQCRAARGDCSLSDGRRGPDEGNARVRPSVRRYRDTITANFSSGHRIFPGETRGAAPTRAVAARPLCGYTSRDVNVLASY
jgi:hypothetical protein